MPLSALAALPEMLRLRSAVQNPLSPKFWLSPSSCATEYREIGDLSRPFQRGRAEARLEPLTRITSRMKYYREENVLVGTHGLHRAVLGPHARHGNAHSES